ncbi:hypothetical protein JM946_08890 [Steroidobacter sp. S1-65]|uniref:Uncharacterized protein n=1 Tax=Steroidobacter gossypii TaxID=2805490 RepID=A0ABS1WV65_9GAMM|nr:hypothetical protein [Steroidobacter gossypii]MBM0104863.1 hypothetical protein [Steroidobacter gossypii]
MALRTEFFADLEDLKLTLEAFRKLGEFRYTALSGAVNAELAEYRDPLSLMEVGIVTPDTPDRGAGYMITERSVTITTRRIEMLDGSGFKRTLDQSSNPDSVHIALGGELGARILIGSILDTHGDTERARATYALFKKVIVKRSKRVSNRQVMPGAMQKLEQGWRLTADKGFHPGLDLRKPLRLEKSVCLK